MWGHAAKATPPAVTLAPGQPLGRLSGMDVLRIWMALVAASAVGVTLDVLTHPNRAMPVMNWVWPLAALYFGPFGALIYVLLSGRRTAPGRVHVAPALPPAPAMEHEEAAELAPPMRAAEAPATHPPAGAAMSGMDDPLWMRSLRSSTPCMAGCALGDLVAMVAIQGLGWRPFGGGATGEVVLGAMLAFLFGLFIFQALSVMAERRLGLIAGLSIALRADLLTIAGYLAGQVPTLYALWGSVGATAAGAGMGPMSLVAMHASMAVGFITTYPVNYWLVASGVKHGM